MSSLCTFQHEPLKFLSVCLGHFSRACRLLAVCVSGPHTGPKMRSHGTHCSRSSQDRAAGLLPIPPGLPSAILKINRASTVSVTPQPVLLSFLILAEISNFTVLILVQLNLAFSSFRRCHESNSKREKKMSAGFSPQGRKQGADGIQLPLPS